MRWRVKKWNFHMVIYIFHFLRPAQRYNALSNFKKNSKTAVVLITGVTISGTPCPWHITTISCRSIFGPRGPGLSNPSFLRPFSKWHRQQTTTPVTNEASSARTYSDFLKRFLSYITRNDAIAWKSCLNYNACMFNPFRSHKVIVWWIAAVSAGISSFVHTQVHSQFNVECYTEIFGEGRKFDSLPRFPRSLSQSLPAVVWTQATCWVLSEFSFSR